MSNSYDAVILADSPVSYWPLDEPSGTVANDLAGSNNGTYQGTGGTNYHLGQSGPSSTFGGAVSFDGSAGYVSVPDATNLRVTGPLTLECWIKLSALSTGSSNFPAIVAKRDASNGYQWLVHANDGGGYTNRAFCGLIKSGSETDNGSTGLPAAFVTGQWYHVVVTYDNVNPLLIYINGILVQTTNIGANKCGASTAALTIGNFVVSGVTGFLNGVMAGAAVYNTVLTPTQILHHYVAGLFGPPIDGLAATQFTNGSSGSITLTTFGSNDIILVGVSQAQASPLTVTSVMATGLTFAQRKAAIGSGTTQEKLDLWWATAASPLTAASITINLSGTYSGTWTAVAFGISGRYIASPFDSGGSLPAVSNAAPPSSVISTTQADDVILALFGAIGTNIVAQTGVPAGFTLLTNAGTIASGINTEISIAYKSVSASQSGITVTWGSVGGATDPLMIVDALTADAPPATGNAPFLLAHF